MNEEGSGGWPGHVFRVFFLLQEATSLMYVIDVSLVSHNLGCLGQAQSGQGKHKRFHYIILKDSIKI